MAEEEKELKAIQQGCRQLTNKFYAILAKQPGNIFFSPLSVHAILSLAYQGSKGETREIFSKVLNLPDAKTVAEVYKNVLTQLTSLQDVNVVLINKILLRDSYKVEENFKNIAKENFLCDVELLDFAHPYESAAKVNSSIEEKSNNAIRNIINPQYMHDASFILVNAIYFNGKWDNPFDPKLTSNRPFYYTTKKFFCKRRESVRVSTMIMEDLESIYKKDECLYAKILELPYTNKELSLVFILPIKQNDINGLEKRLKNYDLTNITEDHVKMKIDISIPKFKFGKTNDLMGPLTKLGLGMIFTPRADFSGITGTSSQPLQVSKIIQKVCIDVKEEGMAASTNIALESRQNGLAYTEKEYFIANHPFVVILRHGKGNILFMGRISAPHLCL